MGYLATRSLHHPRRNRSGAPVPLPADVAEEAAFTTYLMMNIHSPKAKEMFATLGSLSPVEKAKALRKEATAAGVTPCALADEFDPAGK